VGAQVRLVRDSESVADLCLGKVAEGKAEALATGKPLMVLLWKTWCGACKSLRPRFAGSAAIASAASSLVIVLLTWRVVRIVHGFAVTAQDELDDKELRAAQVRIATGLVPVGSLPSFLSAWRLLALPAYRGIDGCLGARLLLGAQRAEDAAAAAAFLGDGMEPEAFVCWPPPPAGAACCPRCRSCSGAAPTTATP
jgi:hypothetical protein